MPTIHYTKKQFIKNLSDLIGDDEHVILTNEIDGTIEALKKKKVKRVPFVFASDAFESQDSIGDLLKSKMLAVVIMSDKFVAEPFRKDADTKKG